MIGLFFICAKLNRRSMGENFREVCKIISSNLYVKTHSNSENIAHFQNQEIGYLYISELLVKYDTSKLNLKKKKLSFLSFDDSCINHHTNLHHKVRKRFENLVGNLGLFVENKESKLIITFQKPRIFSGHITCGKEQIFIRSDLPEVKINFIDEKYKFCKNKLEKQLSIDLSKLSFSGVTQTSLKYKRDAYWCKQEFIEANSCKKVSDLMEWLSFLTIDPLTVLTYKINEYINGKIPAFILLHDISYSSIYFDISSIDVNHLAIHLEDLISKCLVEKATYQLFLQVSFLIICKKVIFREKIYDSINKNSSHYKPSLSPVKRFSHTKSIKKAFVRTIQKAVSNWNRVDIADSMRLNPLYNFPFLYNPLVSNKVYTRISENVVRKIQNILEDSGISRVSIIEIFHLLHAYKKIQIPLNTFFIQKIFSLFTSYEMLSKIFQFKLGTDDCIDCVLKLFCKSLNSDIKHNCGIDQLYELYLFNFYCSDKLYSESILNSISDIHLSRIKKSVIIDELKPIKQSILKCEKAFGVQDTKSDLKLKEKAAMLLNARICK